MKTILLIDDDKQLRITFGLVLRRNGYQVIEADSGATGLEMALQHLPDLIISDIHMPGGDGPTLLRALRSDPELNSKQIILMTGDPDHSSQEHGGRSGRFSGQAGWHGSVTELRRSAIQARVRQLAGGRSNADTASLFRAALSLP